MVESVQSGAKMTSRLGKLVQFCKRSLVAGSLAAALGVTAFAGFEGYKFHKATSNPGEWTQKENIEAILTRDSFILDRNGTRIASLSGKKDAHREYTTFSQFPPHLINAFISAEDKDFWQHGHGVDYLAFGKAIGRGVMKKIAGGSVTSGASTIEMQLAKMLQGLDRGKGFASKLAYKQKQIENTWELTEALLQRHNGDWQVAKQTAFEYYANSIYVAPDTYGFAHGAKYFFSKNVKDLNLIESAFIAGLVQSPSRYNPIRKTGKRYERSLKWANWRVNYVLGRMKDDGHITDSEHKKALVSLKKKGIPFKPARVIKARDSLTDAVVSELKQYNLEDTLLREGITITTTIDADQQEYAWYAVRQKLSELSMELDGPIPAKGKLSHVSHYEPLHFYNARIRRVVNKGKRSRIEVEFKNGRIMGGIIPYEGIVRAAQLYKNHQKGRSNRRLRSRDIKKFLSSLKTGDMLRTSIRDTKFNKFIVDIEQPTNIEGAYVRLGDNGAIHSMIGSNTNRDLNHVYRGHFPGSTLKPLLFAYAFSQGWQLDDIVNDIERTYQIGRNTWTPINSHHDGNLNTTLWSAGVHSSNVATAELFFKLHDKLDSTQYHTVALQVGMGQQDDEDPATYQKRMLDEFGFRLTPQVVRRIKYKNAITNAARSLKSRGTPSDVVESVRVLSEFWSKDAYRVLQRLKKRAWRKHKKEVLNELVTYQSLNYVDMSSSLRSAKLDLQTKNPQGHFYLTVDNGQFLPSYSSQRKENGIEFAHSHLYQVQAAKIPLRISGDRVPHTSFTKDDITIEGYTVSSIKSIAHNYVTAPVVINGEGLMTDEEARFNYAKQIDARPDQIDSMTFEDFLRLNNQIKRLQDDLTLIEKRQMPQGHFGLIATTDGFIPAYSTHKIEHGVVFDTTKSLDSILDSSKLTAILHKNTNHQRLYIDGNIPGYALDEISAQMKKIKEPSLYDHPDFQATLNARAFKQFLQTIGIGSSKKWEDAPSVILGAGTISPLELAAAYKAVLSGRYCEPHLIDEVKLAGKVIYKHEPVCTEIEPITASVSNRVMQILQGTNQYGTAKQLGAFNIDKDVVRPIGSITLGENEDKVSIVTGGKTGTSMRSESLTYVLSAPSDLSHIRPETMDIHVGWIGHRGKGIQQRPLVYRYIKNWGSNTADMVATIYNRQISNQSVHEDLWVDYPSSEDEILYINPATGKLHDLKLYHASCKFRKVTLPLEYKDGYACLPGFVVSVKDSETLPIVPIFVDLKQNYFKK